MSTIFPWIIILLILVILSMFINIWWKNRIWNNVWIYQKICLLNWTIGKFGESLVSNSKGPVECLTFNNRPCQPRPTLVNVNSDETLFYPFTVVLISVVKVATLLMIHMPEFAFQIKYRIWVQKYLI